MAQGQSESVSSERLEVTCTGGPAAVLLTKMETGVLLSLQNRPASARRGSALETSLTESAQPGLQDKDRRH